MPTEFAPNQPLRLPVAAKIAFPDGTMTASGLRREALRGKLVIECIAGKHYTTLAAIDAMRTQCHVNVNPPDSGYSQPEEKKKRFGAFSTTEPNEALAAARARLSRHKTR